MRYKRELRRLPLSSFNYNKTYRLQTLNYCALCIIEVTDNIHMSLAIGQVDKCHEESKLEKSTTYRGVAGQSMLVKSLKSDRSKDYVITIRKKRIRTVRKSFTT